MNFNEIRDENLVYFGERIEPYFASSIIIRGMLDHNNLNNILELKTGVRWLYTNNYFFMFKADLLKIKADITKNFTRKSKGYANSLIKRCIEQGNDLITISKKVQKESERNIDKDKMYELLNAYITAASNYMIFQNIALFEESIAEITKDLVSRDSKNNEEAIKLNNLITTPSMLTAAEKERDDFLKICSAVNSEKLLEEHTKRYGWLSLRFFVGEPWTKEYVISKIKDKVIAKEELTNRLEHRENVEKMISLATKNFSQKDKETVKLIRDMVYLRTQRTDYFQESSYYIQPLLKKIAKELEVTYSELLYLSAQEILLALKNKLNYSEIIQKRKIAFLVVFDQDKDIILESDVAIKYVSEIPILNRDVIKVKEVSGKVAYPGSARGRVRIIKVDKDNSSFLKGEILVSIMTTPNLTPSMEKAAAIITDEGGITCHAAIFAREMKKPCIIGTKIATKVFKDGDLVEVDAKNGSVRLLNN